MQSLTKINVEELKNQILRLHPMRVRFRLSISEDDAYSILRAAFEAEVEYRNRQFQYNDAVKKQLQHLAKWLTQEDSKVSVMLCGTFGNGKSTMLRAFQQLLNYLRIPQPYSQGYYGIRVVDAKFIANLCRKDYDAFMKLARCDMLGIDDLGTEPCEVNDYGNLVTPMIDLLSKRYEEQLFTFITTNLQPKEIRERYGDRMADRLNEMVEKIIFVNDSYRG